MARQFALFPMALRFVQPAQTSRGVLEHKPFVLVQVKEDDRQGWGEVSWIAGLSRDEPLSIEAVTCRVMERWRRGASAGEVLADPVLSEYPGVRTGIEMALRALEAEHPLEWFPSEFTEGRQRIPINGLIWMDTFDRMEAAVAERLAEDFSTIKIKVGATDFDAEVAFLQRLRRRFGDEFVLRLDANGAFPAREALQRLERLAPLGVHSIEQPIAPGHPEAMAQLVSESPIPIALDEELVRAADVATMHRLLEEIRPPYVVLKPSLLGGVDVAGDLLDHIRRLGGDGWVTSALESNLGLAYLAQWTATLRPSLPQGLGTGRLFERNFALPLVIEGGTLRWQPPTPDPADVIFLHL